MKKGFVALLLGVLCCALTGQMLHAQLVIPPSGSISRIAGLGTGAINESACGRKSDSGDGGQASASQFSCVVSISTDANNNLYIGETAFIRKINASTGIITTLAGTGALATYVDGVPATSAPLYSPTMSTAVDKSGNIYIADDVDFKILKIAASTGIITTIAGDGTSGYSGDGGPAQYAELQRPTAIALDGDGNIYIADGTSVRKISVSTGILSTIAGINGTGGYSGDGGLAVNAGLNSAAYAITVDANKNVYFADSYRIRKIDAATGVISTLAGDDTTDQDTGDGGPAVNAKLVEPTGLAVDREGNLYISETAMFISSTYVGSRVRKISASTGIISAFAGGSGYVFSGIPGPAVNAGLFPSGIALDANGDLFIVDTWNGSVYAIGNSAPTATSIFTSNSSVYYGANVTFTASVTSSSGTPNSGTVTFYADGASIGSGTLDGYGHASISKSDLTIGSHLISADYAGSGSYLPSSGGPITQTITTVPTGISFTTSPNPSLVTNAVNIQIQVTASNGQTPTGSISVVADGSTNLGTPALSGGAASVSTTSLAVGTHPITVSYGGTSLFDSSSVTQSQTVNQIPTTTMVTVTPPASTFGQCVTYTATVAASLGTPTGSVSFKANSTSLGSGTLNASGVATVSSCTLASGTYTITASYGGSPNYATSSGTSSSVAVNKANVTLSWNNPAAITYGTALSGTQLNASSGGVIGTFVYTPAAGTVLSAGTHTLSVSFTPSDTTNYNTPSPISVTIVVNKAQPILTWATPAAITYGTALSLTQLNAGATGVTGASLPGSFAYSPVSGTILGAGTYTLSVTFTPTDSTDYNTATATVSLVVNKANITLTWATPAAITYGTALSSAQLNASAGGVAGSLAYSPTAGTVLSAGSHSLTATFTPSDTTNYNTPSPISVTIMVNKANPTLLWTTPAAITYGTALSNAQLNASATGVTGSSLAGSFTYSPVAGAVLSAGTQTLSVTFAPTDSTNYNSAVTSVLLVVNKAQPILTWATPAAITYGTALSSTQLNASATGVTGSALAGSFVYSPAAGTVLSAGTHTLSVLFAPSDATNYSTPSPISVTIVVNKANPTLTWATPAAITYGTALSSTQLSASATGVTGSSLTGSFIYSPVAGTVLSAGSQTLSVTFAPTDSTNYTSAAASVLLVVNKAQPILTWATPAAITYGTALSTTQLNASATGVGGVSLPGSFVYNPTAATVLSVGSHTLNVTFTPMDAADYTTAVATATISIIKATPVVSVSVSPEPSYPGDYATITATVSSVNSTYPTGSVTFSIDGTAAGSAILSSGAATLSYSFAQVGSHTITATFGGDANYNTASGSGQHNVVLIPTSTVVSATPNPAIGGQQSVTLQTITIFPNLEPGTANKRQPLTGTVQFFDGGMLLGSVAINSTTELAHLTVSSMTVGTHSLTAVYAGDSNYMSSTAPAFAETLVAPISAVAVSGNADSAQTTSVTYSATVANPLKQPQNTGTVKWTANGVTLGTSTVGVGGTTSYTATFPTPGIYVITASYSGNQQPGSTTVSQTVLSNGANGTQGSGPFNMAGPEETAQMGQDGSISTSITLVSGTATSPIALTCSGAPTGYTCAVSPSSVTLDGSKTPTPITVTVMHGGTTTQAQNKATSEIAFAGIGLGFLGLIGLRQKARAISLLFFVLGMLSASLGLAACGGKLYASYAPQTYSVTVTGTVGAYKESLVINVKR